VKEQIILLEEHDDVDSIREKLGWVRAARVLLLFPSVPRQQIIQRKLDLVLIQREAARQQAQLALVTHDPVIKEHAAELGLPCFPTVEASHRRYWEAVQTQRSIEREEQPVKLSQELAEVGSRLTSQPEPLSPETRRLIVTAFAALSMLVLGVAFVLLLPRAQIQIAPTSNQVSVTSKITADPASMEVDTVRNIIPARVIGVEVEAAATADSTGVTQIPSEKATGSALFTNLIPDQVTIPQGATIRTSAAEPIRFVTLAEATLPGQIGEVVEVPIEAVEPGFQSNLPSNRIIEVEGPLAAQVAVTNPDSTRGGDTVEVPSISEADHERLRAIVLQQLQQRAYAEMQTDPYIDLQETEFIPVESLSVVLVHSETYIGSVGQTVDTTSLSMRVTVQGVAIDERFARQAIYEQVIDQIGDGYQINPDTLVFRLGEVTDVSEDRQVTFVMQGAGDVSAAVDLDEVRRLVRGKPIGQVAGILERSFALDRTPEIRVSPPLWPWMPLLALRIDVRTF
jgi:hypothetical protein